METRSIIPNATDGASKIQKNFAARQRLIVATIAALTAGGIAAALGASGSRWPAAISWVCVVVVLTALLRASSALFTAALGALCLIAVIEILQGSIPALAAPLFGGALLGLAELSYWSFDLRMSVPQSSATIRRRAGVIASVVVVGAGTSALLLALLGLVGTLGI